jgi:uncharacterized protein (TIGR02118 family)
MHKISVLYPTGVGSTFDMDYYRTKHREICFQSLAGLVRMDIEEGIDGPYHAVGHLYFPSLEALQASTTGAKAGDAAADVPNYTNVTPVIQISQVID